MFQVSSTAVQAQKTYSIVVASVFLEPIACGQNFKKKKKLFPLLYPSWGCFGEVSKSQTLFVFVQTSNFQRTYSSKLAGKSREKRTMRNLVRRNKSHYYTICFLGFSAGDVKVYTDDKGIERYAISTEPAKKMENIGEPQLEASQKPREDSYAASEPEEAEAEPEAYSILGVRKDGEQ